MSFHIVRNDIVNMAVDAIVNSANPHVRIGAGVDGTIYRKAGALRLLAARKKIGELQPGQAAVTPGFGLRARYIIHTVGSVWQDGAHREGELLYSCYRTSLELALKLGCESVAFPMISTGAYGFPKDKALQTAVSAISEFLMHHEMTIYLVVFDRRSFELSGKLFENVDAFVDEKYVTEADRLARSLLCSMPLGAERRTGDTEVVNQANARQVCLGLGLERRTEGTEGLTAAEAVKARSLEEVISQLGETFSQCLFRLIDEKGKTDVEVYKKANLDRKLFSKIRSNEKYQPSKKTVLALAVALELNLDETKDFLGKAGLAFSPGSVSDLIVQYFIMNEMYDIYQINLSLFEHEQQTLG